MAQLQVVCDDGTVIRVPADPDEEGEEWTTPASGPAGL
jgi:hypothetical protein